MFSPTISKRSRVSIMILRGESNLPVKFAGQDEVHLPHSVHVYASNKFFQVKSVTSFAPKRCGSAVASAGAANGSAVGSIINFTSFVTDSKFVNFPFFSKFE